MIKKIIGKSTLFIVLFLGITLLLGEFFGGTKNDTLDGFYYEEKNRVDVVFFGSSHAYCGINPQVIWEEIGVPSYNLGQPEQQIWTTYYFMKEAFKYQKPKVVMMDVLTANYSEEYMPIENSNINLDNLKLSINKLENIQTSVPLRERPYFVFKLFKNKANWKAIKKDNFTTNFTHLKHHNKGYREETGIYENQRPEVPTVTSSKQLPDKVESYLNKIIDLCKEENIPLVLMKTPSYVSEEDQKGYNRVKEIAKAKDIPFIDFNRKYDELGLDFKVDFLDELKHLNFRGAEKLSVYLARYLENNFNLENKKDQEAYAQWNKDMERWQRRDEELRLRQEKNLDIYLSLLENTPYASDYTVAITIKEMKEDKLLVIDRLKAIGFPLTEEKLKHLSYRGILNNHEIRYEAYGDQNLTLEEQLENNKWEIGFHGGNTSIKVNGKEMAKNKGNIDIVIYDKVVDRVIDSSSFELEAINGIKR